jgi:hypothetical protein
LRKSPVSPRRALVFALTGILAYCLGLIALIPAQVLLPKSDVWQVGGTIWHGEAVLAGTTRLDWHTSLLASLSRLAPVADWHMTGGATDLAGRASPGPGQLRLDSVNGVADQTVLNIAAPNLPVACRFLAQVNLDRLVIGGSDQQASGSVRTSPVHCDVKAVGAARGGAATALDLPALHGSIGAMHGLSSGTLLTAPSHQALVEARLDRTGALSLWPTAELTRRVPALGGARLDTTLTW